MQRQLGFSVRQGLYLLIDKPWDGRHRSSTSHSLPSHVVGQDHGIAGHHLHPEYVYDSSHNISKSKGLRDFESTAN